MLRLYSSSISCRVCSLQYRSLLPRSLPKCLVLPLWFRNGSVAVPERLRRRRLSRRPLQQAKLLDQRLTSRSQPLCTNKLRLVLLLYRPLLSVVSCRFVGRNQLLAPNCSLPTFDGNDVCCPPARGVYLERSCALRTCSEGHPPPPHYRILDRTRRPMKRPLLSSSRSDEASSCLSPYLCALFQNDRKRFES